MDRGFEAIETEQDEVKLSTCLPEVGDGASVNRNMEQVTARLQELYTNPDVQAKQNANQWLQDFQKEVRPYPSRALSLTAPRLIILNCTSNLPGVQRARSSRRSKRLWSRNCSPRRRLRPRFSSFPLQSEPTRAQRAVHSGHLRLARFEPPGPQCPAGFPAGSTAV